MNIETHKHYYFDDLSLSSKEFYAAIEDIIKKRRFPKVECSRTSFSEGGLFSDKREYLKVRRDRYQYLICAAPFGTSFFVSYWLEEAESLRNRLFARIPLIGAWLMRNAQVKTFYEWDTELLFKESITDVIGDVVKTLSDTKGYRQEAEAVAG